MLHLKVLTLSKRVVDQMAIIHHIDNATAEAAKWHGYVRIDNAYMRADYAIVEMADGRWVKLSLAGVYTHHLTGAQAGMIAVGLGDKIKLTQIYIS